MKTAFDLSLLFYIPFITNSIDSIDDAEAKMTNSCKRKVAHMDTADSSAMNRLVHPMMPKLPFVGPPD